MSRRKAEKTAPLQLSVWYNSESGHIHMATRNDGGRFITTVNNDPASKQGHPNLYWKLARWMQHREVPHPPLEEVIDTLETDA